MSVYSEYILRILYKDGTIKDMGPAHSYAFNDTIDDFKNGERWDWLDPKTMQPAWRQDGYIVPDGNGKHKYVIACSCGDCKDKNCIEEKYGIIINT